MGINIDVTTMTAVILDSDTAPTVVCKLGPINPVTQAPWGSVDELQAYANNVAGDSRYFSPYLSPEQEGELRKAQLQDEIITAVQQRLDSFAATRNYNGMLSLCTYATSTNAKFSAEGQYGVELRDATWAKCYEILGEVEAGTRPLPTGYDEIAPELPTPNWPV